MDLGRIGRLCLGMAACVALLGARPALAQTETTGSISGTVVDQQGGVLPGATVVAVHTPTGTTYKAVTQGDGRYAILNVGVGGPYTVTATMTGFEPQDRKSQTVKLGEDTAVNFALVLQTRTETVTVTAPLIDTTQAGAVANISQAQADSIPTIARSLIDVVQANPYFSGYITNGNAQTSFSVAGRNNRYNNIMIDGAVNNDIFGLSATGTPEGQSNAQPISIDAIQEYQLLVSPYDVRQGGFSGGGVNIVTRSGTNALAGDGFYYGRNQSFVGKYYNPGTGATSAPIATFSDKQFGASVGGPIRHNKVFFFGTIDSQRQQTPSGISIDGSNPNFAPSLGATAKADVDAILSTLQTKYGYNPAGGSGIDAEGQFTKATNSDKVFVRADVNLSDSERLTVRHNFVNSLADVSTPTATAFYLPDNYYRFRIKTNSTVVELNSTFGNASVNELRVASTAIRNRRSGEPFEQAPFPNFQVTIAPGISIYGGRDYSSTANQLFQDNLEINDNLSMVRGRHTFTVGTHDEFFHFRNLFIQSTFGRYQFTSLANFEAGIAQYYSYNYSNTGNPLQQADFRVSQYGVYAGDQWRPTARLTVTGGIRVDLPRFNHAPNPNPLTVTDFNLATDVTPSPAQWSPRVGFNWDPTGTGKKQLRGGIGVFTGRTPYVWISNQFSNNGVDFTSITINSNANNKIPFNPDPYSQPTNPTGGTVTTAKATINVIDPNFTFPSQLRGNLGYDTDLPWGLVGTAEFTWNRTLQDVFYENLNLQQTGTSALDGRPTFAPLYPTVGPAIYLTNTSAGHGWGLMFQARRPFRTRLGFDVGYAYGRQKTPEDFGSSVALTNWSNIYATDTRNPPLTTSDFDPGHRVTANVSYEILAWQDAPTTVSIFYSGQSGHPYTLAYSFDANGDAQNFNDLLYLSPSNANLAYTASNGAVSAQTLQNFFQTIGACATNNIGSITTRNACRAPWINMLNARFDVGLPFKRLHADVTLDILNLLNLLNSRWGLVQFVNFNEIDVINPTVKSGTVTSLNLTTINSPSFRPFAIDDLRSRWQMQLGVRIKF
jgi:Carboxypeptidase regulatory-like domain/TonB dependent receptor-like, beta-barrel